VLRDQAAISLPVLRKLKELAAGGAAIIGPRPATATGLSDYPQCDAEVKELADGLWGRGKVIVGQTAREALLARGVPPDFEFGGGDAETALDYIHRSDAGADIYFVANRAPRPESVACTFRVAGKTPELWDAVSGSRRPAAAYQIKDGRTTLPLAFPPCGSMFVVFRRPAVGDGKAPTNFPPCRPLAEIAGPWTVKFDPRWGGPASATFDQLTSWPERSEPGIKFYSGTATYGKDFDLPADTPKSGARLWLDLGSVRELAAVRLNGQDLGIVWSPPFRVDITAAAKARGNVLEVEVVNFWPNRIIGDHSLPPDKRFTKTNIRKLTKDTPLMPAGLLGPVTLQAERE